MKKREKRWECIKAKEERGDLLRNETLIEDLM